MEISRHWRLREQRLAGSGSTAVVAEIDDEHLRVKDNLRGREINLNHGSESGEHVNDWAEGLVAAMRGWGYADGYIGEVAVGLAQSMNGTGERFLRAVGEVMADD